VNQSFEQLITLLHNISSTLLKVMYLYNDRTIMNMQWNWESDSLIYLVNLWSLLMRIRHSYRIRIYITKCMTISQTVWIVIWYWWEGMPSTTLLLQWTTTLTQSRIPMHRSRTNRSNHIYSSRKCGDLISLMD